MASKYLQKYPVPQDFASVLHDLTREILRDQPEDIVEYAALYFEAKRDVSLEIKLCQFHSFFLQEIF